MFAKYIQPALPTAVVVLIVLAVLAYVAPEAVKKHFRV